MLNFDSQSTRSKAGLLLARGVSIHMRNRGFECLEEFVPERGLRVDVVALGRKGEVWIIECKSSRHDFMSDHKWQKYLAYCDQYFFAVDQDFPRNILPDESGLIIADEFDAEILRFGHIYKNIPPPRRKKLIIKFGRTAASRLVRNSLGNQILTY